MNVLKSALETCFKHMRENGDIRSTATVNKCPQFTLTDEIIEWAKTQGYSIDENIEDGEYFISPIFNVDLN